MIAGLLLAASLATAAGAESATAPAHSRDCLAPAGGRVVLAAEAVDPDVFLWDSRERLIGYAAGRWGSTRAIFAHTVLARPGTRAIVVACVAAVAYPVAAGGEEDAVGVRLLSGPHRGRYGWVISSDAHLADPAPTRAASAANASTTAP